MSSLLFLFVLLSVAFAAGEPTMELNKRSPGTTKAKPNTTGCIQKRDGISLYRRGGAAPARIAETQPGRPFASTGPFASNQHLFSYLSILFLRLRLKAS
jgi:hypothetical protein